MSDQLPILVTRGPLPDIAIQSDAITLRDAALETAAIIGRVTNADEQEQAVAAQKELAAVIKLCEASRKAVKEPFITIGRTIDKTAKLFLADCEDEKERLGALVGHYQYEEQEKARLAEVARKAAENERLAEIERETQAAIAKAAEEKKSLEEIDAIRDAASEKVAEIQDELPAVVAPPRVAGQTVTEDIEVTIVNERELALRCPQLVTRYQFDMRAIKEQDRLGVSLPGVTFRKVIKAGVRV